MDVFSTDYLMGVVQDLKRPSSFILDRFFRGVVQDTSEEIHFDVVDRSRRIAPFVSPLVEGRIMNQQGRTVKTFQPAYVKDKRVFDSNRPFKRAIGESIGGGQFTPEQRLGFAIAGELEDQIAVLHRRFEVMGMEALRTGQETIEGENYPAQVVDFGRDAALSPAALAGGDLWTADTSDPLSDLKAWSLLGVKKSGVALTEVICSPAAFDAFVNHASVQARWQAANINVTGSLKLGDVITEGGVYMGTLEGFNFYVYVGWYIDLAGDEVEILPDGEIVMASPAVDGVRAYGAIKDLDSLQAVEMFVKSWPQQDPSVRFVMLQSAPLMVPTRPNASLGATVV